MKKKVILLLLIVIVLVPILSACGNRPDKGQPDTMNLPAPILLSPEQNKKTGDTTPQFQWSVVVGATSYTFEIKNAADNSVVSKKNYTADARCDESVCKIPTPQKLTVGEYKWHVIAWIGELKTDWSDYRNLTIQ